MILKRQDEMALNFTAELKIREGVTHWLSQQKNVKCTESKETNDTISTKNHCDFEKIGWDGPKFYCKIEDKWRCNPLIKPTKECRWMVKSENEEFDGRWKYTRMWKIGDKWKPEHRRVKELKKAKIVN